MSTKMKKFVKNKKKKLKKTSVHMAQGKPQLKFERNPCNNFRDNRCYRRTTDGRTDDRRRTNLDFMIPNVVICNMLSVVFNTTSYNSRNMFNKSNCVFDDSHQNKCNYVSTNYVGYDL